MTLREFIKILEDLASAEGDQIDVVVVDREEEPSEPYVAVQFSESGRRRVKIT